MTIMSMAELAQRRPDKVGLDVALYHFWGTLKHPDIQQLKTYIHDMVEGAGQPRHEAFAQQKVQDFFGQQEKPFADANAWAEAAFARIRESAPQFKTLLGEFTQERQTVRDMTEAYRTGKTHDWAAIAKRQDGVTGKVRQLNGINWGTFGGTQDHYGFMFHPPITR